MKVVFEGLVPEDRLPKQAESATVRAPKKSRTKLRPITSDLRLFHAFYA